LPSENELKDLMTKLPETGFEKDKVYWARDLGKYSHGYKKDGWKYKKGSYGAEAVRPIRGF
jgi:hypothetical protein